MGCRGVPLQRTLVALVLLAAALVASCGGPGSSGERAATSAPAASSTSGSAALISARDSLAVRDLVRAYWAAYNAYDPEKAISYLDEGYRPSKEKAVRDEIGRLKTFHVQLGVSEKSAPVLIGPGLAEMYLGMKTPIGTRTVWMKAVRRGSMWAITYAEEVR
jgi:hypothetical protein